MSGQYKVIRMFREFYDNEMTLTNPCKCEVFTIEIGSWRSVAGPPTTYVWKDSVVFLNGSLHWLVRNSKRILWILCFDLETEEFTTFSFPLHQLVHTILDNICLCVLEDRMCLSGNSGYETTIWLMNKYGDKQWWMKEIVIRRFYDKSLFPNQSLQRWRCVDGNEAKPRTVSLLEQDSEFGKNRSYPIFCLKPLQPS